MNENISLDFMAAFNTMIICVIFVCASIGLLGYYYIEFEERKKYHLILGIICIALALISIIISPVIHQVLLNFYAEVIK